MSPMTQKPLTPGGLPGRRSPAPLEKAEKPLAVLRRLANYFSVYRTRLALVFLLVVINSAGTIGGAYLLRPIINHNILQHDGPGLVRMSLLLLAVYLVGSAAGFLQARIMVTVAQRVVATLRADLFAHLQELPVQYFDTRSRGDLMSRFTNDIDNISEALNDSMIQLCSSSLALAGTVVLMLYISAFLTLISLVIVPLMLWLARRIAAGSRTYFTEQQVALGAADGYIEEIISGLRVVKVFCHEEAASRQFGQLNDVLQQKSEKAQWYSGIMMPLMSNLNTINFALTAAAGGLLAVLRGLDIGGLAAFLQYSRQFALPVNEISSQFNSLQNALAGAERIFQVLDEPAETATVTVETAGETRGSGMAELGGRTVVEAGQAAGDRAVLRMPVRGEVRFEHVSFGYDAAHPVLLDISLEALPGQKIALVGSTGAGKTTIINLLPRFYDIQSGRITIDGVDIRTIGRDRLREMMAIVLQDTHLFTATVMENIRYGRLDASDDEVIAAAKLAGAHGFIRRLPQGYQTVLDNQSVQLSQGQRQLLTIARAAVAAPVILILDEATSSIDTRTEIAIQAGLDHLMKGRTSFIIAHRLSTVRNADEILVLEQGRIIERGTHDALLRQKGRYYELYAGQFD